MARPRPRPRGACAAATWQMVAHPCAVPIPTRMRSPRRGLALAALALTHRGVLAGVAVKEEDRPQLSANYVAVLTWYCEETDHEAAEVCNLLWTHNHLLHTDDVTQLRGLSKKMCSSIPGSLSLSLCGPHDPSRATGTRSRRGRRWCRETCSARSSPHSATTSKRPGAAARARARMHRTKASPLRSPRPCSQEALPERAERAPAVHGAGLCGHRALPRATVAAGGARRADTGLVVVATAHARRTGRSRAGRPRATCRWSTGSGARRR